MRTIHKPIAQEEFDAQYVILQEIAARAGVNRNTVQLWLTRGNIPQPDAVVGPCLVWKRDNIEPYILGYESVRIAKEQRDLAVSRRRSGESEHAPVDQVAA